MVHQKQRFDILFWVFTVYVFMILVFSRQFSYLKLGPNLYITEVVIVVILAGLTTRRILSKQSLTQTSFDKYLYLYLAAGLLFFILSVARNGMSAMRGWVPFYLYSVFYFFTIKLINQRAKYLKIFIISCFTGIVISMFYLIYRQINNEYLFFNTTKVFGGAATSLYASFAIFFILPFIEYIKKYRNLIIIYLIVNSLLILLSTTRGAIVSYLFAFLTYAILDKQIRILKVVAAGIPLLIISFLIINWSFDLYSNDYLMDRGSEFTTIFIDTGKEGPAGTNANSSWRKAVWHALILQTLDKNILFGSFFGTPIKIHTLGKIYFGSEGQLQPHNSFIHIFFRTGLIGFLPIAVIVIAYFKRMFRGFQHGMNPENRLFLSMICIMVYYLTTASLNVVLEGPYMGVFFWIIIGIGILFEEFDKRAIKII